MHIATYVHEHHMEVDGKFCSGSGVRGEHGEHRCLRHASRLSTRNPQRHIIHSEHMASGQLTCEREANAINENVTDCLGRYIVYTSCGADFCQSYSFLAAYGSVPSVSSLPWPSRKAFTIVPPSDRYRTTREYGETPGKPESVNHNPLRDHLLLPHRLTQYPLHTLYRWSSLATAAHDEQALRQWGLDLFISNYRCHRVRGAVLSVWDHIHPAHRADATPPVSHHGPHRVSDGTFFAQTILQMRKRLIKLELTHRLCSRSPPT